MHAYIFFNSCVRIGTKHKLKILKPLFMLILNKNLLLYKQAGVLDNETKKGKTRWLINFTTKMIFYT